MHNIHKNTYPLAIIAAILAFLSFSTLDSLVKVLSQEYDVIYISSYFRFSSTILLLLVMIIKAILQGDKKTFVKLFKINHPYIHLIRGVLLIIISIAFTKGFSILPLNIGYSIVFLLPMVTAVFGVIFLKEHISKIGLFSIIGGFIGVLIVLRPGAVPFSINYLIGYISLFIGIVTEAPFFILIRQYHKNDNPLNVTLYPSIISSIALVFIMLINNISFEIETLLHLFIILMGGILYILSQTLLAFSLARITAHTSIAMQYSQIIWGSVFGFFWFKDTTFSFNYLIGIVIIILCSYTVATGKFPFIPTKNRTLEN